MSVTKRSKTVKGRATKTTPGDLAEHLAAVFYHPETPADLYNLLLDWVGGREAAHLNRLRETPAYAGHLRQILDLRAEAGGGAGAKAPPDASDLEARAASLTPGEARALCEDFARRLAGRDEEDAADLLTLLTAATFKRDPADREALLLAAQAAFMPMMPGAVAAVDALVSGRLEAWRG